MKLFLTSFEYTPSENEPVKHILKIITQNTHLSEADTFMLLNFLRDGRLSAEELSIMIFNNTSGEMKKNFIAWLARIYEMEQGKAFKYKIAPASSSSSHQFIGGVM